MNSKKDLEDFFKKYNEYCAYKYPKFFIETFTEPSRVQEEQTLPIGGISANMNVKIPNNQTTNFMNQFANLSLNPTPMVRPVIYFDPNRGIPPQMRPPVNNLGGPFPRMTAPHFSNIPNVPFANPKHIQYGGQFGPRNNVQYRQYGPKQQNVSSGVHFGKKFNNNFYPQQKFNQRGGYRQNLNTYPINVNNPVTTTEVNKISQEDSSQMEDVAASIYEEVEKIYPE
jgi:hypothetical protein